VDEHARLRAVTQPVDVEGQLLDAGRRDVLAEQCVEHRGLAGLDVAHERDAHRLVEMLHGLLERGSQA
jgi:hypothetical protein